MKVSRMFLLHAGWPDDWRTTFVIVKAVSSVRGRHLNLNAASSAKCKMQDVKSRIGDGRCAIVVCGEAAARLYQALLRKFGVGIKGLPCTAVPRVTGSLRYLAAKHVRRARPVDGLTA